MPALALAVAAALTAAAVLSPCAAAIDTLAPGAPLAANDTLVSAGGLFALGFFTPPGSSNRYVAIWYNDGAVVGTLSVVWILNRAAPITNASAGDSLSMSSSGALILTAGDTGRTVYRWPENFSGAGSKAPAARLLDSGNFVGTDTSTGVELWQSFDYPADTLIAGMKLGADKATGKNWSLTAWKTDSDPSPSDVTFAIDLSGYPEYFIYAGGKTVWRSGPWSGRHFSGDRTYNDTVAFVNTAAQAYLTFWNTNGSSVIVRVNHTGVLQKWLRFPGGAVEFYWAAPNDLCDVVGSCGHNGVCYADNLRYCSCPPGFVPKNAGDWNQLVWGGGCTRGTPADCAGGSDGFAEIKIVKMPDTSKSVVYGAGVAGIEECKKECLKNCSCTAVAVADVVTVTGCLMWFGDLDDMRTYSGDSSIDDGQHLFVRVSAAAAAAGASVSPGGTGDINAGGSTAPPALVASLTVGAAALLAGLAGCYFYFKIWRKKKKQPAVRQTEVADDDLPLLDVETIAGATAGFSNANKIGEGGFGPVHKGKLPDGQEIAIKRLAKSSSQGEAEFKNEVRLIAKLQHRNLVRLLGCCIHGDDKMLVYEFVPNGSLDAHLFGKQRTGVLDWPTRYQIIIGVARGLQYLHEDSRLRIIHRDLKASNILLDQEMNPKISDFGMARILGGDETTMLKTRRIVGTYGYMSPEYAMYGTFSTKSDVFSYGVLVLEIISGRRNTGRTSDHTSLLSDAWNLWKDGNALEAVDSMLGCTYDAAQVVKCIKLGLLCVQEYAGDRPVMSRVLQMMSHDAESLPDPNKPGFVDPTPLGLPRIAPLMDDTTGSDNSVTITLIQGR